MESAVEKHKSGSWTEESLGEKINAFKKDADSTGLVCFLEARLADETPCCVSNRARFWNELGLARMEQESFELAKTCFENALKIVPDYTLAQFNLATFFMQRGDFEAALKLYNAVLDNHPDHCSCLLNAGLCYSYKEDKASAAPLLIKAANLNSDNGQVQFIVGEILLQAGQGKAALPFFKAAYKLNPGHFESAQGLAITLLESGAYEEAISICDSALIEYGPATLPLQVKADALIVLGKIHKAIECHVDLTRIDLDIRDFLVTRILRLAKEDRSAFTQYNDIVSKQYPEFSSFLGNALKKEDQ